MIFKPVASPAGRVKCKTKCHCNSIVHHLSTRHKLFILGRYPTPSLALCLLPPSLPSPSPRPLDPYSPPPPTRLDAPFSILHKSWASDGRNPTATRPLRPYLPDTHKHTHTYMPTYPAPLHTHTHERTPRRHTPLPPAASPPRCCRPLDLLIACVIHACIHKNKCGFELQMGDKRVCVRRACASVCANFFV